MVVVMRTQEGYIKRVDLDEYQAQNREVKEELELAKEGDFPVELYSMGSHDHLLFFTTAGVCISLRLGKYQMFPDIQRVHLWFSYSKIR